MNVLHYMRIIARALDYAKDPDPKHWKTINGSHVHLDKNGNYDGGAGSKFNGRHHYGPDWRQKSALMNRLAAALHGGVAKGQAQGQNVAPKATNGSGSGHSLPPGITIKPEVKATDFPPEYSAPSKKAALKVVVNTLNGIRDKDPAIFHLYSNLGELAQATGAKVKIQHSTKRGRLSVGVYPRFECDVRVRNPVQKGDGPNTRRKSLGTWFHENMHFIDYMIGQQTNTSRWRAQAMSTGYTNLSNAIQTASQNPRPSQEIGDWLKDAEIKEAKVYDDAIELRNSLHKELDKKKSAMTTAQIMLECDRIRLAVADFLEKGIEEARKGDLAFHGNLSDLYDALAGGKYYDSGLDGVNLSGHGTVYYSKPGTKEKELIANWGALRVMAPELADKFRKDKPDVAKALDEVIDEMCKRV